jgi:hypothetical protein
MIAAHDFVPPVYFPSKSGLQKPETFGSHGVIMCIKKRNRHGVFTPWNFFPNSASPSPHAARWERISTQLGGSLEFRLY